jgi:hypothetical protein
MLNKKVRIPIMLLICLILLFSVLVINHGSMENLSIINFPYSFRFIPFGF